jgi:hypothetical protein
MMKRLLTVLSLSFMALILLGVSELYVTSFFATFYMWGEGTYPGPIYDYWGVRIYDGFYWHLGVASSLLVAASALFLALEIIGAWRPGHVDSGIAKWNLRFGLLLPTLFTWGLPQGPFYHMAAPGFSLTGIVSPLYSFVFAGSYYCSASFIPLSAVGPFQLLGGIQLLVGVGQYIALKRFEQRRLRLSLFLLPVLASLIQTVLLFGVALPQTLTAFENLVLFTLPVPTFTIGVLIRAVARPVPSDL